MASASPATAAAAAGASDSAAASLIALQRLLLRCNALEKSQRNSIRELRTKLVSFENTLTRTLTLDHCVHAILEHDTRSIATPTGSGGVAAAQHQQLLHNTTAAVASAAAAAAAPTRPGGSGAGAGAVVGVGMSAAEAKELHERERERELLSAVRRVNFVSKPFGYSQELGYKQLLHHLRAHPALLAQALSTVCAPPVRWSTDTTHRMDQLARCLVVDVFGGNRCVHDHVAAHTHTASAQLRAQSLRAADYQFLRLMRDTCTLLCRRHLLALASGSSSGSGSASSFSVLEYNSFSAKLLTAYVSRVGSEYLRHTIRDTVQSIVLSDDYDFNTDFTGAEVQSGDPLFLVLRKLLNAILSPPPPTAFHRARSASIITGTGTAPNATGAASPSAATATAAAGPTSSLPIMPYGVRYLARLLMELADATAAARAQAQAQAAQVQPPAEGAPAASSDAAAGASPSSTVSTSTNGGSAPASTSASTSTSASAPPPPVVADFVFLQWLVNALMYPDSSSGAAGAALGLDLSYPITPLARRNLHVVGTVLMKLASGSRFATYHHTGHTNTTSNNNSNSNSNSGAAGGNGKAPASAATPLNQFLDSYQPQMNAFLKAIVAVDDLDDHFADVPAVQRRRSRVARAAAFVSGALAPAAAVADAKSAPAEGGTGAAVAPNAGVVELLGVAANAAVGDDDAESDGDESPGAADACSPGDECVERLEPLAVLPNDLFTAHRLLRSVLNSSSAAGASSASAAAATAAGASLTKRVSTPSGSPASTTTSLSQPLAAASPAGTPAGAGPQSIAMTTFASSSSSPATAATGVGAGPRAITPPPAAAAPATSGSAPPPTASAAPPSTAPAASNPASPAPAPPLPSQSALRVRLPPNRWLPLLTKTSHQLIGLVSKSRARVTKLLASIGDPTPYVATADNQYVLLDAGVGLLAQADAEEAAGSGGADKFELPATPGGNAAVAVDAPTQRLIDLFTSCLATLRALPLEYTAPTAANDPPAPPGVIQILQLEAEREWALGNSARAAIVYECIERLNACSVEALRSAPNVSANANANANAPAPTTATEATGVSTATATTTASPAAAASPAAEFDPLLQLLLTHYARKHRRLMANDACGRVAQVTGLLAEYAEWLSARDKACTTALLDCQIARVLSHTQPKVRGLVMYLAKQDEQLSRTPLLSLAAVATAAGQQPPYSDYLQPPPARPPTRALAPAPAPSPPLTPHSLSATDAIMSTLFARAAPQPNASAAAAAAAAAAPPVFLPSCAGACPEALEDDRFVCENCQRRLEGHRRTGRSFTAKYAVVHDRDVRLLPHSALANSSAAGAVLSPSDPLVATKIADYVTAAAYSGMFVRCSRADTSWCTAVKVLALAFPDFASFYVFVNSKEEKSSSAGPNSKATAAAAAAAAAKQKAVKAPALSALTFDTATRELSALDDVRSVAAKMACFARARDVISSVLQHSALASGADDYIPALCYALIRANPPTLLSNISFVRVFAGDASANHKGFVDVCVAVKYLVHLSGQIIQQQPHLLQRVLPPSASPPPPSAHAVLPLSPVTAAAVAAGVPSARPVGGAGPIAPHPQLMMTTLGTLVGTVIPAGGSGAAGAGATAAAVQQPSYTTQAPPAPPSANAPAVREGVTKSLRGMGFAENDIAMALSTLPAADSGAMERAFPFALDWLTDFAKLLELGYPRDFVTKALLKVGPRQLPQAVQFIDAMQLRG